VVEEEDQQEMDDDVYDKGIGFKNGHGHGHGHGGNTK
jgi:hypothetical protein